MVFLIVVLLVICYNLVIMLLIERQFWKCCFQYSSNSFSISVRLFIGLNDSILLVGLFVNPIGSILDILNMYGIVGVFIIELKMCVICGAMFSFIVLIILEFIWSCPVELDGLIFLIICIVSLFVIYGSLKLLICLGINLFSIVIGSQFLLLKFCLNEFI